MGPQVGGVAGVGDASELRYASNPTHTCRLSYSCHHACCSVSPQDVESLVVTMHAIFEDSFMRGEDLWADYLVPPGPAPISIRTSECGVYTGTQGHSEAPECPRAWSCCRVCARPRGGRGINCEILWKGPAPISIRTSKSLTLSQAVVWMLWEPAFAV
jgi:hypothetical protein